MPEIIHLGSLKLKFLQSKEETAGSIDMFEMTVQPNALCLYRTITTGGMRRFTGSPAQRHGGLTARILM